MPLYSAHPATVVCDGAKGSYERDWRCWRNKAFGLRPRNSAAKLARLAGWVQQPDGRWFCERCWAEGLTVPRWKEGMPREAPREVFA